MVGISKMNLDFILSPPEVAHNWRSNLEIHISFLFCTERKVILLSLSHKTSFCRWSKLANSLILGPLQTVHFHWTATQWPLESLHSRGTLPKTSRGSSSMVRSRLKCSKKESKKTCWIGSTLLIRKLGQDTQNTKTCRGRRKKDGWVGGFWRWMTAGYWSPLDMALTSTEQGTGKDWTRHWQGLNKALASTLHGTGKHWTRHWQNTDKALLAAR